MFWTRKHQIESSNHEGFFKNFPCRRPFLQEFYKVQTNFVGFFHARCLNFPCFITYLAACMHAFCMFYLYVSLGVSHIMKVEWVPVAAIIKEDAFSKRTINFEYRRHYMEKISVKRKRSVWIRLRVFMTHKKC